ncbi:MULTISPECIES: hypothetical protein [unclassified Pseudomonas]|jgi:hypothetical protein|uniref:hypothetical protein n=1 Tax=unclassified Pseudomonas TaxID=196821 RepID=UPI000BC47F84|nr:MULTISPECIES: hypothetical protein [unclassified Pseudomonas]PCR98148.1 hypothetical protein CP336_00570 [Pseudomonas fluorescens]PMX04300.1 hypothetical protein C1X59_02495 [Pseudomonas sp. FW215-R2]PMX10028.1 hypothetical protein C1X60_11525 [Pseudomonas sp. FW215-L1]PMX26152.1 hypothetical protein C1X57_00425 [Pseudomonas sp. FW215-E1]PNA27092.1 hypothetical protein C1X58_19980 [Pseudomonas sp. FW215-R4]
MERYFLDLIDDNYFGDLALVCFVVGLLGLFPKFRNNRIHQVLNFLCVMAIPLMFAIGVYYMMSSGV